MKNIVIVHKTSTEFNIKIQNIRKKRTNIDDYVGLTAIIKNGIKYSWLDKKTRNLEE